MTQILHEKFGAFALITAFHLAALWMLAVGLNKPSLAPPAPLPMVMVEMLPAVQPVQQQIPQPKPPEPKPQPKETPKPQPKKEVAKPQPKKEAPRTTNSEKALTAPKQEAPPVQPAAPAPPEPSAPPSPPAPPGPPAPAPVTPPRFNAAYLNNPAPVYPPILRRAGEEGRVVLRVFVTAEGIAGEVQVLRPSSSALFDEAALSAVRKWRFVPAKRGDTAVAEWVQVPIDFKLN
ncbi:energy transducer TonB [Noviherbaspirillum aerium]|uniref:energy transducer TonB n=1 Tax=Noviherbaspirillum aerium TaxID=2588497 RepID=UPI00124DCB13|nr:energy transducer TonB [Noviherbaspirillum aerium]